MFAASSGSQEVVEYLLSLDIVDPNAHNTAHRTALMFAAFKGHANIVKVFIANNIG